jgi:non-specific serine/threonine protein kinase
MGFELAISPEGRLHAVEAAGGGADAAAVRAAFAESAATGLLALAALESGAGLPPGCAYWREFTHEFLTRLCHAPEIDQAGAAAAATLPAPDAAWLAFRCLEVPPMPGAEYVSPDMLSARWAELAALAAAEIAKEAGGARDWLRKVDPSWRFVGKVSFHLAENKRDPEHPFAFLATYVNRVGDGGRLKHLPLSAALKEYAADKGALLSLLMPVQRAAEASPFIKTMLESKELFQPLAWTPAQAYRFLTDAPRFEGAGVVVRLPNWWRSAAPPRPKVAVSLDLKKGVKAGVDALLEFAVSVTLDGQELTPAEIDAIRTATKGLVLLRGQWVEADPEKLQQLLQGWDEARRNAQDGVSFLDGLRMLSGVGRGLLQEGMADASAVPAWSRVEATGRLRDLLAEIGEPAKLAGPALPPALEQTLRPYQRDGVKWLWLMSELGLGACLADDMGLGKTIQVLAMLTALKAKQAGCSILVVPTSLMANWRQEAAKFAPALRLLIAHPSALAQERLDALEAAPEPVLKDYDVVVTSYGMLTRQPWLAKLDWLCVIIDEAQAIKTPGTKQSKAVKALKAKRRFALTGTPVENRLDDLWSIFNFLCPQLLGTMADFKRFTKSMVNDEGAVNYAPLRSLTKPYILRRLKSDQRVITDLPEKTEMKVNCPLSKTQAVLYQDSVDDLRRRLKEAEGIQRRGIVLSFLMRFKQICNHPSQWTADGVYEPAKSGKFQRLAEIAEEIASRQDKALVFTQFREMTAPLDALLATVFGAPGLVLHGETPVRRRQELVEQFNHPDGPPYFVLSLKAGGTGLNLTAASHVIHFDRWWNPAVENQATDRAYRIGQRRNVLVHKFVCAGTLEERIDAIIEQKKGMADSLLTEGGERLLTEMSNEELLNFVALDVNSAIPNG